MTLAPLDLISAHPWQRVTFTTYALSLSFFEAVTVADDLRAAVQGKTGNGDIRLFHNLDTSISEQLVQVADELGGATRLLAAAPFWDQGAAIDGLCKAMGLNEVFLHAHATGTVEGRAGSNWPFGCRNKIHPVRLEVMDD